MAHYALTCIKQKASLISETRIYEEQMLIKNRTNRMETKLKEMCELVSVVELRQQFKPSVY